MQFIDFNNILFRLGILPQTTKHMYIRLSIHVIRKWFERRYPNILAAERSCSSIPRFILFIIHYLCIIINISIIIKIR